MWVVHHNHPKTVDAIGLKMGALADIHHLGTWGTAPLGLGDGARCWLDLTLDVDGDEVLLIHKAVAGDWQAIKKCVELREKYTISRTETLGKMVEHAQALRTAYRERYEMMPDDLWALVDYAEQVAAEGQFRAG